MTYEPPTQWELDTVRGPLPGMVAFRDTVMFWQHGEVVDLGIYNRRPAGSSALAGQPVTVRNASVHAVGRAWDPGVTKPVGDLLVWRCCAAWDALGLCEIIWQRARTTDGRTWRRYTGPDPHTGHPHIAQTIAMAHSTAPHDALARWNAHFLYGINY